MTLNTKVKLCVLGDIMLLVLFGVFVPYLWLKLVLMTVVVVDLVLGIDRFANLVYAEDYNEEDESEEDDGEEV